MELAPTGCLWHARLACTGERRIYLSEGHNPVLIQFLKIRCEQFKDDYLNVTLVFHLSVSMIASFRLGFEDSPSLLREL